MLAGIKAWIYGAGAAAIMTVAGWLYVRGRKDKRRELEIDDYEHAEDIRRRVSTDRADELRKHDDAGWRDD